MGDESINGLSEDSLNKSVYIKRFDRETMMFFHTNQCLDWMQTLKNIASAPEMKPFIENPNSDEYKGRTLPEICLELGGEDLLKKIIAFDHGVKNFGPKGIRGNRELLLNTHGQIYETQKYEDFERRLRLKGKLPLVLQILLFTPVRFNRLWSQRQISQHHSTLGVPLESQHWL